MNLFHIYLKYRYHTYDNIIKIDFSMLINIEWRIRKMIFSNEWERESAILMILGVHATKFLLCTPKTPIDNGFHSLSRFRHFITKWIDSRARHEYTRAQNGNITEHTNNWIQIFEFSISYSRFLRRKSKIWKYRNHRLRIFHGLISVQILFFFFLFIKWWIVHDLHNLSIFSLVFVRGFFFRRESSD